jgi:mRNA interferase HigB
MRVISKRRLREFWELFPDAELPLKAWFRTAERSHWANFADVRTTFSSVSGVALECEITAIVFNIGGNKFRLITRIEYPFHAVYVKMVLTHRQYDTDKWKDELCRD